MERISTVATFNAARPAEALKDRFCDAGLNAEVKDESVSQSTIYLSREPRAHMRVRVLTEELEKAKAKIREWEKGDYVRSGPLPPMRLLPHRVPPILPAHPGKHLFRPAGGGPSHPEGVLLRGLPFHLAGQSPAGSGPGRAQLAPKLESALGRLLNDLSMLRCDGFWSVIVATSEIFWDARPAVWYQY